MKVTNTKKQKTTVITPKLVSGEAGFSGVVDTNTKQFWNTYN